MTNKRKHTAIITAIVMLVIAAISAAVYILHRAPYRYCENCLLSNKEYFDALPDIIKKYGLNGKVSMKDKDTPDEILEILDSLNKQYQKDSDYPVFTALEISSDPNGSIAVSIQARKEYLKNGDGKESPDIRCCCLVYIEPEYSGDIHAKEKAPFYGSWRTWSFDAYSG